MRVNTYPGAQAERLGGQGLLRRGLVGKRENWGSGAVRGNGGRGGLPATCRRCRVGMRRGCGGGLEHVQLLGMHRSPERAAPRHGPLLITTGHPAAPCHR